MSLPGPVSSYLRWVPCLQLFWFISQLQADRAGSGMAVYPGTGHVTRDVAMSLSLESPRAAASLRPGSPWVPLAQRHQANEVDGAASPAVAGPYPARRFHAPTSHDLRILFCELDSCSRPDGPNPAASMMRGVRAWLSLHDQRRRTPWRCDHSCHSRRVRRARLLALVLC